MQDKVKATALMSCAALGLWVGPAGDASACTRLFCNAASEPVVMARAMDLSTSDQAKLLVRLRGASYTSPEVQNAVSWTARYGSVAAAASK
jgi:penicillin V acylase-like amidase (Ntn superfamily)